MMPVDLAAAITMNNSKFKTMICKNFETLGACALGEKCHFAHGVKELRTTNGPYKTMLCKRFEAGGCNLGEKCQFAHGTDELRCLNTPQQGPIKANFKTMLCRHFAQSGGCPMHDKCHFAHGMPELRSIDKPMAGMPDMSAISEEMMGDYDPYTGLPMQNKVVPPTANYKTMTCKNFDEKGECRYGNTCTFAHGTGDIRKAGDLLPNTINIMKQYEESLGNMGLPMKRVMAEYGDYSESDLIMMGYGGYPGYSEYPQVPEMNMGNMGNMGNMSMGMGMGMGMPQDMGNMGNMGMPPQYPGLPVIQNPLPSSALLSTPTPRPKGLLTKNYSAEQQNPATKVVVITPDEAGVGEEGEGIQGGRDLEKPVEGVRTRRPPKERRWDVEAPSSVSLSVSATVESPVEGVKDSDVALNNKKKLILKEIMAEESKTDEVKDDITSKSKDIKGTKDIKDIKDTT